LTLHRILRRVVASGGADLQRREVRRELVRSWGNDLWVAQDEFLEAVVQWAMRSEGPILECGSGLSTLVLGLLAQPRGLEVWTLEHDPDWAQKVSRILASHGVTSVRLLRVDLKHFGDYSWYDVPLAEMPGGFSLVVCDGPPGSTPGGRYGLLPVMRSRLAGGCRILLDDAGRIDERDILRRWATEAGADYRLAGDIKPYGVLTLGSKGT